MRIREAAPADAPALRAIYAPYVRETAVTFEYETPSVAEFAGRIQATLEKYPYFVAEEQGEILGYAYAGAFKSRAAYAWAAELSIYLRQDCRGRGVGKALYAALEAALRAQGVLNLDACITLGQQPDAHWTPASIHFHARMGFAQVAHFRQCGYKFERWYDMIWMEKAVGEHAVPPAPFLPWPLLRRQGYAIEA